MALSKLKGAAELSQLNKDRTDGIFGLPVELLLDITDVMDTKDLCTLRLTCKYLLGNVETTFIKVLIQNKVIYTLHLGSKVKSLTLVAEGLREHEFGSAWAWEEVEHRVGLKVTAKDQNIIATINRDHANEVHFNNAFLTSGRYRTMLAGILAMCPNLQVLNIRKLQPDEHVPGWTDISLFKQLSFYRPGLDTKSIYYGDWQYDTVHLRITHYTDEFGESIVEDNAGSQASFADDVEAAIAFTGRVIEQKLLN